MMLKALRSILGRTAPASTPANVPMPVLGNQRWSRVKREMYRDTAYWCSLHTPADGMRFSRLQPSPAFFVAVFTDAHGEECEYGIAIGNGGFCGFVAL